MSFTQNTPREIVAELDKYIVGQTAAKRAVAVALRNRFRRDQLPPEVRAGIIPKNILMIGPTGVGKTEIARRLASLAGAPMLKIEATKFTEIGYVGREVDAIVRDLVEIAIAMVEREKIGAVKEAARDAVQERLLELLVPRPQRASSASAPNPFGPMWPPAAPTETERLQNEQTERLRARIAEKLNAGQLEESEVEVEIEEKRGSNVAFFAPGMEESGGDMSQMLSGFFPQNKKKRRLKVREARPILEHQEAERLLDRDAIVSEAIERAQENGIVFLDEIDKIAGREGAGGPQVSREGVQRDLLPLVEGATVNTKYGPVATDHMLFIAAGAFHVSRPSDLIPELQGRFPIRVELEPLSEEDLRRILTEPQNALTDQYRALLGADGVQIEFTADGIAEIARFAAQVNDSTENIGARRLHTLVEKVLEEVAFEAPEGDEKTVRVNASFVRARLAHLVSDDDLSRFIL
ncbi:MAG TPA: ATP-dependent protease ATPase subunit HslU [Abditibacterium sp.]|jgi:ATP-dependent HslUV protease ATP-binding subunit HslU